MRRADNRLLLVRTSHDALLGVLDYGDISCHLNFFLLIHHISLDDLDLRLGPVLRVGRHQAHPLYHPDTLLDPPKDGVLAVQPRRGGQSDEELTAVGVGACVGHAEDACARVCVSRRSSALVSMLPSLSHNFEMIVLFFSPVTRGHPFRLITP